MTFSTAEIKACFKEQGVSISTWAQAHAFDPRLVYAVLAGKNQSTRGKSHQIALALGLKEAIPANQVAVRLGLVEPNKQGDSKCLD
ncbi:MAG: DNA-binding protein [Rhodoferax sp.]|uniref:DNA-binding protein n=1 Tax=Rhodoferax sp. TaxID=50421 RepID=UPI00180CE7BA|nr:DNA-binding protein [Rhodoferax sp.]NMM12417.1 DNA-binding protein [Rhodoferax sp.]